MLLSDGEIHLLVRQTHPFYYQDTQRCSPWMSDKALSLFLPVAVYWASCTFYHMLDVLRPAFSEKYRMHPSEQLTKRNRVSMRNVLFMVASQHLLQTILGIIVLEDTPYDGVRRTDVDPEAGVLRIANILRHYLELDRSGDIFLVRAAIALYWWGIPWLQFWFGCFVMDAWQYILHRSMHEVRWLYRVLHSHHHRLYVPYAFGALYNHPLEGVLLDTLGAAVAQELSRMTLRQSIPFFCIATYKTVSDHCGYAFPWYYHPFHLLFPNNAEYHDVHHQSQGLRYNYSQPFFVHFDTVLGTRIDPEEFHALLAQKAEKSDALDSNVSGAVEHTRARALTAQPKPHLVV
ncbi:hypothetical protein MVES_003427 [Malassezia vespertilionis]|uniref:Fatty acid hydroxylase domain-containing protein n=1 Tax=Malassezia vespertilionis TaxID=2020962 RepID=A0A2N1J7R2_9BASI|nr:hypothetical protein MVES_003427 [Malassezia vespertilionis]